MTKETYTIKLYAGLINPNPVGYIKTNLKGFAINTSIDLLNHAVVHTVHIGKTEIPVFNFHKMNNGTKKNPKKVSN